MGLARPCHYPRTMVVEGWFYIAASVLVMSGVTKLADTGPTRGALRQAGLPSARPVVLLLALFEMGAGATGVLVGGIPGGLAVAACYGGFAVFVTWALARGLPLATCGCFGKADTPPTVLHLLFNGAGLGGAIAVAAGRGPSLPELLAGRPVMAALLYLAFAVTGVYLAFLILSRLPSLRVVR
jgi:hypothetical protein